MLPEATPVAVPLEELPLLVADGVPVLMPLLIADGVPVPIALLVADGVPVLLKLPLDEERLTITPVTVPTDCPL